jgi:restriction system protein
MMSASMAIPDYQTLMRPLLAAYEDGQERPVAQARDQLAVEFGLTEDERSEMLPSGKGRKWNNRVGWAATYLYRAGLLERPRRSVYRITDRGRLVLQQNPQRVDNDVLGAFEEFREFSVQRDAGRRRGRLDLDDRGRRHLSPARARR